MPVTEAMNRFLDKVVPEPNTGCWIWSGMCSRKHRYGYFWYSGVNVLAHRWIWQQTNGAIPASFDIDHICRVRECVNPRHLRAVTRRDNLMAPGSLSIVNKNYLKTSCHRGHPLTQDNVYVFNGNHRACRLCKQIAQRKVDAKRKEARRAKTCRSQR